jgi:hypothetical protein
LIIDAYRVISLSIIFFGRHNVTLGADINAEVTFLAQFFINFYGTFQNSIPKKTLVRIFLSKSGESYVAQNGKKVKYFQVVFLFDKDKSAKFC